MLKQLFSIALLASIPYFLEAMTVVEQPKTVGPAPQTAEQDKARTEQLLQEYATNRSALDKQLEQQKLKQELELQDRR